MTFHADEYYFFCTGRSREGFAVMDEAEEASDRPGALSIEVNEGTWRWHVPESNEKYAFKRENPAFRAEIVLQDVTFGYEPGQTVLRHITLYAKRARRLPL